MFSSEVTLFLDGLNHPFRAEIELLRKLILESNPSLTENIKWNGPNYSVNLEDRITMRIQPPAKQVQLILHRGAKKQEQPLKRLIECDSKILVWKENDRAIITFKSIQEIETAKLSLNDIINAWLKAC